MNSYLKILTGTVVVTIPVVYFMRRIFSKDHHETPLIEEEISHEEIEILGRSDIVEEQLDEETGMRKYFKVLTPTLSRFVIFDDATLIIQYWLVSRPFAKIFHHLKFVEDKFS